MPLTRRFHAWFAALLLGCGDPSSSGHLHVGSFTQDETWSLADSPHRVRGGLVIGGGATLTIEAGATVLFEEGAWLSFNGTGGLRALGSAGAPITIRSVQDGAAPGTWRGLFFRFNSSSVLRHVQLSGCGRPGGSLQGDTIPPICVALGNPLLPAERPTLLIDHLTVENAQGGAVGLWGPAEFTAGSAFLSVRNMRGYIARFRAREAARFPLGGTFADNDTNEVRLTADTVRTSLTLAKEVPWAVEDTVLIEGPTTPVLTIPAGTTVGLSGPLRVGLNAPGGLQIGAVGGPTVNLVARGTGWAGIEFRAFAVGSAISDAVFESGGTAGMGGLSLIGSYTGAGPAPAPVLRNVVLRNAVGVGLAMTYGGGPGPGSANLTITGSGAEPIAIEHSPIGAIPSGHYTGNARDRIFINNYDVRHDDTWPNHQIPYYIKGHVVVGDASARPTLTVEPGVTITSAPGNSIVVGDTAPGAMRAIGTAAEPITFMGETSEPGSWGAIVVGPFADSSTAFHHLIVDNGGGTIFAQGSFQFYVDIGPVIRNSTIRNSISCGVTIVNGPPWTTDFTAPALGNTFVDNVRGAICGP